jgi:2-polyprenyl-3-methyl-5-hydroxy-6-metoxy-1,4-benzoquinol methylase
MKSTHYYDDHAEALCSQYNAVAAGAIHGRWKLPDKPGFACDIGAGSGRDANWLASLGWDVVAVEPSAEMRKVAMATSHPSVTWLDDSLPDLKKLRSLGHRFDLILLSAVWMHVPPRARESAFGVLSELFKPSGALVISLRHGADERENAVRGFYKVSADELLKYARRVSMSATCHSKEPDLSRSHVYWQTAVFRKSS